MDHGLKYACILYIKMLEVAVAAYGHTTMALIPFKSIQPHPEFLCERDYRYVTLHIYFDSRNIKFQQNDSM